MLHEILLPTRDVKTALLIDSSRVQVELPRPAVARELTTALTALYFLSDQDAGTRVYPPS